MNELDKVLDTDEKVLWEGKPNFWPFVLQSSMVLIVISVFFFGFLVVFYTTSLRISSGISEISNAFPELYPPTSQGIDIFPIISVVLLIIGLFVLIGPVIYKTLVYKQTYYAITNKRVIIQTGIIGRDFKFIDFDQITNASVDVGFFDKLFGNSGSIILASAGAISEEAVHQSDMSRVASLFSTPYSLKNIKSPYDVFKFFKKTSFDVKTDIQYPNKYRPDVNPGYRTKYKRKR